MKVLDKMVVKLELDGIDEALEQINHLGSVINSKTVISETIKMMLDCGRPFTLNLSHVGEHLDLSIGVGRNDPPPPPRPKRPETSW